MTTAVTNTVAENTGDVPFRTWVAEVIAQLLAIGLTQTGDTGQINTASVARPGVANTAAGYVIFRFNDALQATAPIFIKLEFGTGSAVANPQMWITVGQGSSGAGAITGLQTSRTPVCAGSAIASTVTPYVSRFCYVPAMGVAWMGWKQGAAASVATTGLGGWVIFRSTDATGAPTGESVHLLTNVSANAGAAGSMMVFSYLSNLSYTAAPWPAFHWALHPFALLTTLYGANSQIFPVFQFTPVVGISANMGLALQSEISQGSTVVVALMGVTTHTFIQAGGTPWGGTAVASSASGSAVIGALMPWE